VVAYFTNSWAYFDANAALAEGNVTLGPNGYRVKRDSAYVWFADRSVNAAYDKPEYFMAMTYQGLGLAHLTDDKAARRPRAGDVPLIRAVREGRTSYLHPVEVARDPSPLDRWSIVRLDWDFPPFLQPLGAGEFVGLDASSTQKGTRVHVSYLYAHQEGVPEAGTRVTLLVQSRCDGSGQNAFVSPLLGGTRDFELPRSFAGTVRAEVRPATATKVGPIYTSDLLRIGSQGPCLDASQEPK
jgi:hypothetical protein